MTSQYHCVTPVALPDDARIARMVAPVHFADAYAIDLPSAATRDPEVLARFVFAQLPGWASALLRLRDALMARFGLKTTVQLAAPQPGDTVRRVGFFKVYGITADEIVVGEDDAHLDFRLSLRCSARPGADGKHRLVLSTAVHCHNRLGRVYIFVIAPFHRLIVKSNLRHAARRGWPAASV